MNARRCLRRIRRSVSVGLAHVRKARVAHVARAAADEVRVRFGGGRPTTADVRAIGVALAVAGGTDQDPPIRPVRFAGRVLSIVNAVTFAVVFGRMVGLDVSHADPILSLATAALAVGTTTAQVVLARDVGRRLRPARPPQPLRLALIGASLLALTGGLASVAFYGWAQTTGSGIVTVASGLLLGASALAAPFVVVADQAYGPGPEARLLFRAERVLARGNRRCATLERRAVRHLATAERLLVRAEYALGMATEQFGADHPLVEVLGDAVARLRTELEATWPDDARPDDVEPADPLDPDDLDLAG